jgi:transposase
MGQSPHKQEKACGWNFHIKNGVCFQIFLEQLASEYPEYLNIVQLDNGRFHYSSSLKIPDNILLLFQPPYSPELNPIERVWHYIKQELSWENYENLDALKEKVRAELEELSLLTIASLIPIS